MNSQPQEPDRRKSAPSAVPTRPAALMVAAFLVLAVFFWVDPVGKGPALDAIPPNDPSFASALAVRKARTEMTFDGAPCRSCHEGTEAIQGSPVEKGVFHDRIALKHGRNKHCFNCHHRLQPANFSDFDGSPIKLADVQWLCAKCHGTIFRDWENGAHGRRAGYWDASQGKFKTLVCIACHDPHWPVFKPLRAAAAPHVNPRTRKAAGASAREEPMEEGLH